MSHFNNHRTAESYADMNVATSDDDLIAWVAEYGPIAKTCIRRAIEDPANFTQEYDSIYDKIQAGHWLWLRDQWEQWRSEQDESDKERADIDATDEAHRRWFVWQATH